MPSLDSNQRAAIAAAVQDLRQDLDIPVYIEGDIYQGPGSEAVDMDEGEAARIVVDVILDHPYVIAIRDERDRLWEAMKWLVEHTVPTAEQIPEWAQPAILSAIDAAIMDRPIGS